MTTSQPQRRTDWQLPAGVPRGVWDYAHAPSVAASYDETFGAHGHPTWKLCNGIVSIRPPPKSWSHDPMIFARGAG